MLYTLGGLENLQTAKKYYASTIDLTGGKNTRALFGICLVSSFSSFKNYDGMHLRLLFFSPTKKNLIKKILLHSFFSTSFGFHLSDIKFYPLCSVHLCHISAFKRKEQGRQGESGAPVFGSNSIGERLQAESC